MKTSVLLLILLLSLNCAAQNVNPFAALRYDSVVIYDFESDGERNLSIVTGKGTLAETFRKRALLTTAAAKDLTARLGAKSSYGSVQALCFQPHLGIVYYNAGRIIRHATVCMDCNRLDADVAIPAQRQGRRGSGSKAYFLGTGMSSALRKVLNGYIRKYGFSHAGPDRYP